jgi:hypothetical protein
MTERTIGIYVFLRTLTCSPVRASTIAGEIAAGDTRQRRLLHGSGDVLARKTLSPPQSVIIFKRRTGIKANNNRATRAANIDPALAQLPFSGLERTRRCGAASHVGAPLVRCRRSAATQT